MILNDPFLSLLPRRNYARDRRTCLRILLLLHLEDTNLISLQLYLSLKKAGVARIPASDARVSVYSTSSNESREAQRGDGHLPSLWIRNRSSETGTSSRVSSFLEFEKTFLEFNEKRYSLQNFYKKIKGKKECTFKYRSTHLRGIAFKRVERRREG